MALFAALLGWLMTEELAVGVWTKKSGNGRSAPKSAGSLAGNGVILPLLERLKRLEELAVGVWTKKEKRNPSRIEKVREGFFFLLKIYTDNS